MDQQSNNARFLRATSSRLIDMAEEYPPNSSERADIEEAEETVRRLIRLDDPPEEFDDA